MLNIVFLLVMQVRLYITGCSGRFLRWGAEAVSWVFFLLELLFEYYTVTISSLLLSPLKCLMHNRCSVILLNWDETVNHFIKMKEKEIGSLTCKRQLKIKVSDTLVRTLTSVLPRSATVFTWLCGYRIISIYISSKAKDSSPNHLSKFPEQSLCSLVNKWSCITWAPLTLFHHLLWFL